LTRIHARSNFAVSYGKAHADQPMQTQSKWQSLPTEAINPVSLTIDKTPVRDIIDMVVNEDRKVIAAVQKEKERIAHGVEIIAQALRKNGRLVVCDHHPVIDCVDAVDLRWRESYFEEGRLQLGRIVTAFVGAGLTLVELDELPPPAKEHGGRHDPRIPAEFLLVATKAA